jgi:phage gp29-like protein
MASTTSTQARREIGVSVISDFSIVREREYNKDLKGKKKFEVFEKMADGDGTVQGLLTAMKEPLLRANWSIQAGSDKRADRQVAEFVQKNIMGGGMTRSWKQTLEEVLNYLPLGVMPFELIYDINEQKQFYLRKLSVRHPKTIEKWKTEDNGDGVVQWTGTGRVSIPLWKMAIFVNKRLGDSWEGKSVLRAGYKHWDLKDKYYLVDAIATERQGLGIPIGHMPPGNPERKKDFEKILAKMRVNENAAVVLEDGWTIELLNMQGHTIKDPEKMINHHNRELAKSILAMFMEIGAGSNSGGYAQSRNETEFFTMVLQSVADYIVETMSEYVIKPLVDYNFTVENYPTLTYDRIGSPDLSPWAKAIADLVNAQALTPDHNVESHIREVLELPEIGAVPLSDEMIDAIVQDVHDATNPAPTPFMASADNTKRKLVDLEMEMRKELLEMQSKGQVVTREDIAAFRLKFHDRKALLLRNMPKDQPADQQASVNPMDDKLIEILEEVDHVRASLTT